MRRVADGRWKPIVAAVALTAWGLAMVGILAKRPAAAPVATNPHAAASTELSSDAKHLFALAKQLRSKTWNERERALEALDQFIPSQGPIDFNFGLVVAPIFSLSGWGGIEERRSARAEGVLVRLGPVATFFLQGRLNSREARERQVAVRLLVRIGPRDATLVPVLRPLLTHGDDYVRRAAIDGLGAIREPDPGAIAGLEQVVRSDGSGSHRVAAEVALIRLSGVTADRVQTLTAFLDRNKHSYQAAESAARALGDLGPAARAAEPQLRAALTDDVAGVRMAAVIALGQIAAEETGVVGALATETVTALIDVLTNASEREARRSAAVSLGKIGPRASAAIPALVAALKTADAQGGWWVASDALARIGGPDVVPHLTEALAHADDGIRHTAVRGLGRLGPVARPAVEAIRRVSIDDSRAYIRKAAEEALRQITNPPSAA
jgi:HEAT repeat protein